MKTKSNAINKRKSVDRNKNSIRSHDSLPHSLSFLFFFSTQNLHHRLNKVIFCWRRKSPLKALPVDILNVKTNWPLFCSLIMFFSPLKFLRKETGSLTDVRWKALAESPLFSQKSASEKYEWENFFFSDEDCRDHVDECLLEDVYTFLPPSLPQREEKWHC